jgi:hypothetical protein
MNAENYKTFAIVMASLGVVMLATGLMIFFIYPKMMTSGGPQGGLEVTTTEGQIQDDTFRPDEEATGSDS